MRLTIIGCSGSLAGPDNPASSYLLTPDDDSRSLLIDTGPGAIGVLQQVADPSSVNVAISHLHADHCLDFPSLLVWRRYHPTAPARDKGLLYGPAFAAEHLGLASADAPGDVDDFSDVFDIHRWQDGNMVTIGAFDITPFAVVHPTETYGMHIVERATGHSLVYSADSAFCQNLIEHCAGVDTFLCEASWGDNSEGKAPDMHMSGAEAGTIAAQAGIRRLILTHIPPYVDTTITADAARQVFTGEVCVATSKATYDFPA